jgi:hypothetical protein
MPVRQIAGRVVFGDGNSRFHQGQCLTATGTERAIISLFSVGCDENRMRGSDRLCLG